MQCPACYKHYVNASGIDKWRPWKRFQEEFLKYLLKDCRKRWPKLFLLHCFIFKQEFPCTLRLVFYVCAECLSQSFMNPRMLTSAKIAIGITEQPLVEPVAKYLPNSQLWK